MLRTASAVLALALLAAGCGAKRQTTSSTTASTPEPTIAETATATQTSTPTTTATASPSPTTTPAAAKGTLAVEADPTGQLKFTQAKLTATAGKVTIDFKNPSPTPHNVAIRKGDGNPIAKTAIVADKSATATADLAPGTYEFYCSVPGHEQAGMKGTLTVK